MLPHAAVAVTEATLGAGTDPAQLTVMSDGHVTEGAIFATTVINWLAVAKLPHASEAVHVLNME